MLHNFVLSIDLYVQSKVQKAFPDNKGWTSFSDQLLELVSWKSGSPVSKLSLSLSLSFSLSLPLLFRLNFHLGCGGYPSPVTYPGF